MKTNVLVVYPTLPHYRRAVFHELDRRPELDVTYAADREGRDGIAVMDSSTLSRFEPIRARRFGKVEWDFGVLRLLLARKYPVVIFLGDASVISTWIAALLVRFQGGRVLFWTIGWHRPERGVKKHLRLLFYRLAHVLLLYGNIAKSIGEELGYPVDRMKVIGNSTEADEEVADREVLELPIREPGILWIGAVIRLSPFKRLPLVVESAAVLRERGIDARVLLVGEGPDRERLIELAERQDVPLALPGAAYSLRDLSSVYAVLDVTVVPTAIGLTAIQSLSFGVPIISHHDAHRQMPEWEALVPGVTGEVFTPEDARTLADATERVATMLHHDRAGVAQACRDEVARNWTASMQAERIVGAIGDSIG